MGAEPKRKTSKARKGIRRSHLSLSPPSLVNCPRCNNPKLPYYTCPTCGTYAGREVVELKSPKKKG